MMDWKDGAREALTALVPCLARAQREYLASHGAWKAIADACNGDPLAYVEAAMLNNPEVFDKLIQDWSTR